jgi:hypothetical protein
MKPLRVLFTNISIEQRTGAEMFIHDLALGLMRRGHQALVYSPRLGPLAGGLRGKGIAVVSDIARIGDVPDVIHGQHHTETMIALLRFPGVPGISVCHDRIWWADGAPEFPRICCCVAVDENCRDRLVNEQGISPDRVRVIFNSVDLERFQPRGPLPARPRRALMFSNYAEVHEDNYFDTVRAGCAASGIELEVAGLRAGTATDAPEKLLPRFDVVFGKARCALEAMACGAAVVLCDYRGLGPIVTSVNFPLLRRQNFGMRTLLDPFSVEGIRARLAAYDAEDAAKVTALVRRGCGFESVLDQWIALYEEVREAAARTTPVPLEDELRAASAYLQRLVSELSVPDPRPELALTWTRAIRHCLRPLLPLSIRNWMRRRRWI